MFTFSPRPFYLWRNNTWRPCIDVWERRKICCACRQHLRAFRVSRNYKSPLCSSNTAKQLLIPRLADNLLTSQTRITHYVMLHGSGSHGRGLCSIPVCIVWDVWWQNDTGTGYFFLRVLRLSSVTVSRPLLHIHPPVYHRSNIIFTVTFP